MIAHSTSRQHLLFSLAYRQAKSTTGLRVCVLLYENPSALAHYLNNYEVRD